MNKAVATLTEAFQSEPNDILQKTMDTLSRKSAKCRNQVKEKNTPRIERTKETTRLFDTSTNVPRSANHPSNTKKRGRSRSRSRSRPKARRPTNNQDQYQPRPTTCPAPAQPDTQQPCTSTTREVSFVPKVDREAINKLVTSAIEEYLSDRQNNVTDPTPSRGTNHGGQRSCEGREGQQRSRGHGNHGNRGTRY